MQILNSLTQKISYGIIIFCGVFGFTLINYSKLEWFSSKREVTWKEASYGKIQPQNLSLFSWITPSLASKRPWYFSGGKIQPTISLDFGVQNQNLTIWPEDDPGDRIEKQLMLTISPQTRIKVDLAQYHNRSLTNVKTIVLVGRNYWVKSPGQDAFLRLRCPVNTCSIITNELDERAINADAILFSQHFKPPNFKKEDQIWIMFELESPLRKNISSPKDIFNWTSSYRPDSDISAPYGKFVYYNSNVRQINITVNYAESKSKLVAWFVSNCYDHTNRRKEYVEELQKYIEVDIYGKCGSIICSRSKENDCFEILSRDYKFYLAFENSNCRNYITEKLFKNSLSNNVVPVVMGAHPDDYKRAAPEHSYIHVEDFDSPKELAQYLHKLDKDDELYNKYFRWKGTGELINVELYMCQLCAMLHSPKRPKHYEDINEWWNPPGMCIKGKWRDLEN